MATLSTDATFADCEDLARRVRFLPQEGQDLHLATKISLANRPFGGAALAQSAITWARAYDENSRLVPYIATLDDLAAAVSFSETLHGFVATMMAKRIESNQTKQDLRPLLYPLIRARAEAMNSRRLSETQKGRAASLICVDHSTLAFLSPLYHSPSMEIPYRNEGEFIELLSDLLRATIGEAGGPAIGYETVGTLGVMLRELFANTHEHARTDFDGRPWRRSVRGISVRFHAIDRRRTATFSGSMPALKTFFDDHSSNWGSDAPSMAFAELSVFDSGPGLASRMLQRPSRAISIAEEMAAVRSCFLKHTSSKRHPNAGLGLFRTLSQLKQRNGFLRIRTGRLSLFKSFLPSVVGHFSEALTSAETNLENALVTNVSDLRPVGGTAVSIILPVGN